MSKNYFLTPFGLCPDGKKTDTFMLNVDRFLSHFTSNENFITSMFRYKNLPKSIDERFIEIYYSSNGSLMWTKNNNNELIVARGSRSGNIKDYGLGEDYNGTNDNPEMGSITRKIGVDCVVGYNNSSMTPDFDAFFYADTLKELEKSIRFNIRFARLAPILKASTGMKKEALEELLNNIDDGNMVNVITSNIVDELRNEESSAYETINLTNVDDIKNIQFLVKTYEDLLRIFHTKYGQAEQGNGKLAQQSVDEVNGTTSASFVYALNKFHERQKTIDEVNVMFADILDKPIKVEFSPAWALEYQRYINNVGTHEAPEEEPEKSELESEDSSELESEDESEDSSALDKLKEGEEDEEKN